MKSRYRLFRRGRTYWCQDNDTGQQQSLRTKDKQEAETLLHARNESHRQPALNLQIARTYLQAGDPEMVSRTWQSVMDHMTATKEGSTKTRYEGAIKDAAFDLIRDEKVLETRSQHFLRVLDSGGVATNVFLRRFHNFALGMNWLPWPILPPKQWPEVHYKEKRAITLEEHQRIIDREPNEEMRAFYELCWHFGGSQSDVANLHAEDVDRENGVLMYQRVKTGSMVQIHFGKEAAKTLDSLPVSGPLFPRIAKIQSRHRAKEFNRRCKGLGIRGVSLHSYRYAWAERAKKAGYPERFAQLALGHSSKAVHRAYAKKAQVRLPALEEYEEQIRDRKIVSMLDARGDQAKSVSANA